MDYINKHVKILLKNNIVIEGIVISWDKEVVLRSIDKKSSSIIMQPDQDICVIKIFDEQIKEEEVIIDDITINDSIKNKMDDVVALPVQDDLRLKTIAELKKELNKNERLAIANKLKKNVLTENQNVVRYQYPPFVLKK